MDIGERDRVVESALVHAMEVGSRAGVRGDSPLSCMYLKAPPSLFARALVFHWHVGHRRGRVGAAVAIEPEWELWAADEFADLFEPGDDVR